ncbi:MAG: elongation factor G [Planctomycetota bacterium]
MPKYESKNLRNVALVGHSGSGKTMLAEAMLLRAGVISRLGSIQNGTTVSDYHPLEKEHQYSIDTALMHCHHDGQEFNIFDAPGRMDFFGGQVSAIAGADIAVICVNAVNGVEIITRKAWDIAGKMGKARMIVVTHMDADNVNFSEVLSSIKETFGKRCVRFTIPQGEGASFSGVENVLGETASEEGKALHDEIIENAVEADDDMMEKYLENGTISEEDLHQILPKAIVKRTVVPIFCVASMKDLGVEEFMLDVAEYGPSPFCMPVMAETPPVGEAVLPESVELEPCPDAPLLAQVVKTIIDPHVGKLSFVRILNGMLENKTSVQVSSSGKAEKVANLYRFNGEKHEDVPMGRLGDIVTIGKCEALNTGDTLFASGEHRMPELPFPKPMAGLAVTPKSKKDEQKIGTGLARLCDEDPTFLAIRDQHTHELVVRGMGMIQLDIMLERLAERYHVEVETKPPKIPYMETISAPAEGHYRHKKQSGGAGQFAEVYMRVSPAERGAGFEFKSSVVGGAICASFIGSTEKGCHQALEKGPLAGYPVVDILVDVYDGKEHPVDSKDIAFQTAGRNCLHEAMMKAKPVLLEPIVDLEVVFPPEYTGDISGDVSTRRGRPSGMEMVGDMQMVTAQVPLAEVADYGSTLRAITQGAGFFSMELSHYEPVPGNVAQQLIAKLQAAEAEAVGAK